MAGEMETLTRYMAQAREAVLPPEVAAKAKHHILDTLAAMVSGSVLKPGVLARQYVERQGGPEEAQVVGSSMVVSAVNAAIANGMMAHADETDDSNGSAGIHPGCAILPATDGRLRTIVSDADGHLYMMTSNCDNRGECPPERDKILRIGPAQ